jgi:hypothetical protein
VDHVTSVIDRADRRMAITGGRTVVALAGGTGSGKSSLFNALIGADIAPVGVRRPTTSAPIAAIWGTESASALLDWVNVDQRHIVEKDGGGPPGLPGPASGLEVDGLDGLVLLDLPDFDSLEGSNRREADRVLDLVDVLVWVTDPQKYADARLHEDYITRLSAQGAVTMVVLNQADRLTPEALAACRADLVRLVGAEGVHVAEVIATSATVGTGVIDLCARIGQAVDGHDAAFRRLDADLRAAAQVLRPGVADSEPSLGHPEDASLLDALARAVDVPAILDGVERDYRRESRAHTGWPFVRWAGARHPAPLKLLLLNQGAAAGSGGISESDIGTVLTGSSVQPAAPTSAIELATRELGDTAAVGLPRPWAEAVGDAATPPADMLRDSLDAAVVSTHLGGRTPLWWGVLAALQWVLALAVVCRPGLVPHPDGARMAAALVSRRASPRAAVLPLPALRRWPAHRLPADPAREDRGRDRRPAPQAPGGVRAARLRRAGGRRPSPRTGPACPRPAPDHS